MYWNGQCFSDTVIIWFGLYLKLIGIDHDGHYFQTRLSVLMSSPTFRKIFDKNLKSQFLEDRLYALVILLGVGWNLIWSSAYIPQTTLAVTGVDNIDKRNRKELFFLESRKVARTCEPIICSWAVLWQSGVISKLIFFLLPENLQKTVLLLQFYEGQQTKYLIEAEKQQ